MALTDGRNYYGWASIALHWVGAALVIALYLIGEEAEDAARAERSELMRLHMSIGVIAFVVLGSRLLWRLSQGFPERPRQQHWILDFLATWVARLLLLAILVQIVSGPLTAWTGRAGAVPFFGFFSIPSPIAANEALHEAGEAVHKTGAKAIYYLFWLHVAGALKHLVIDRDGIFQRMLYIGLQRD